VWRFAPSAEILLKPTHRETLKKSTHFMRSTKNPLIVGMACLAVVGFPLCTHGATVEWGGWTDVTNVAGIQTPAGYTYGGVNFNGSTTTINNGTQDVVFTGIAQNASGTAAGITVANSGFAFGSTGGGNSNVVSAVGAPTTWATVLDQVIGDNNNSATINLSGLTIGKQYTVQFFSSTPDANINSTTRITSGGVQTAQFGAHASGGTRYNIATFTADATSQSFAITGAEPTFGALVIGVQAVDTTPPTLTGSNIVDNQGGGPVAANTPMAYTVTFSEDINAATVAADDFENAGTAAINIGTVTETTPGVFSVAVTPTTTGTLILQIKQNALIEDLAGNDLNTTSAIPDNTTITVTAETTPPTWIATWPQAAPLSTTSLSVRAHTNETGTAYYVILPDGAPAPSAAQVKAGTNSSNTPVSSSGSLVLTANIEATASVTGLSPGTAYDVYFVAQDAVPNLQASPAKVDAATLAPDTTPPAWIATWPQATPLSTTSLSVRAKTNETGNAYYVVLANGAAPPSSVQVKAGMDSTNSATLQSGSLVLTANTEASTPVTGLVTDNTYDVYFVAEDAVPNLQTFPTVVSVSLSSTGMEPIISELVAVGSTLQDENLTAQDWIEIHNPNAFSIDLAGYYLTDDAALLTKWAFPSTTLAPGAYLVVFASDKNRTVSGSPLHTNFKLGSSGEYLALVKPGGTTVVSQYSPNFPGQIEGFSYGLNASAASGYFSPPTPGAANGSLVPPLAAPIFSPACAAFTTSTSVTIAESIPGAGNVIRYTTNGSEPTISSTLYSGPVTISTTTHLRARVFSTTGASGAITGGLYQQLATTSNLAGINSPGTFTSDLPIMVVENFGAGAIPAVDATLLQTARMAVYDPPVGTSVLSGTADSCFRIGIKRRGNSSRNWEKGQYRVELRDEADGDLDAGLLGLPAESDWVLHGPYADKSLIRNDLIYDLGRELGMEAPRTKHFELFLNLDGGDLKSSDYAGVYVLVEKIKQGKNRTNITEMSNTDNLAPEVTGGYIVHFDEPFHINEGGGLKPTNWNSLEIDEPKASTTAQKNYIGQYMDTFAATLGWARGSGANNSGVINNDPVTGYPAYINADSFVDLILMNELTKNQDAYVSSDYMYKDREGKLHKGPLWDFNLTMGIGCCHNNPSLKTGWMLGLKFCRGGDEHSYEPDFLVPLLRDADFRQQWIDKWFKLRRYGAFEDAALNARIDSHATPLTAAAQRNFVKWPILGSSSVGGFGTPVTATWAQQIDQIKDWLEFRMMWIDSQLPNPVVFSPNPGAVAAGTLVTLTATSGTIYYTTDGSDPRLAGGGISPAAIAISSGGTVPINATTSLLTRTYHTTWATTPSGTAWGATWGAPTQITYVVGTPASASNLLVTEVNYHPADPATAEELADPNFRNDDFEFIEVKNISGGPVDLSGMAFIDGISHYVLPTQVLASGEYGVFVESLPAFRARYGDSPRVLGVYSDKLSNDGEAVKLVDLAGATIKTFTFNDIWYPSTDGPGDTLAALNTTTAGADLSNPLSWEASAHPLGTPGMANDSINFAGWLRENFTAMELADPRSVSTRTCPTARRSCLRADWSTTPVTTTWRSVSAVSNREAM
jgi:CotH kinase protein/Chitobiase/beta-hexosaminidase C-terminal domain/Lamin Tail Domain